MLWAGLAALALAAWIYQPLFFPSPPRGVEGGGEQFFFEVNEAAGAPVLLLSLWLFYRRSHLIDELLGPGKPLWGAAVWLVTVLVFAWGLYTGAADLQLATLISFLVGLYLVWGGLDAVRAFGLPTLFLGFALPISPVLISAIIWSVQLMTAEYAGWVLNAIGVPSFVQGDQIWRPEASFIVIETCSGLRSVVTLTMLTILLIDLFERRGRHAALLLVLAPVVALLTNGIRVVTLVLNPHSDVASIHSLQGILMLLVGLTLIYGIDLLLARALGTPDPGGDGADYGSQRSGSPLSRRRIAALASPAAVLVFMIAMRAAVAPYDATTTLREPVDSVVLRALGDLQSAPKSPNYKYRGSIHYRGFSRRLVAVGGGVVDLTVGLENPTNRKLTMVSGRFAQPDSGWEQLDETQESLVPGAPAARRVLFRRGAKQMLSFSWYEPRPSWVESFLRHALALDRSPVAPRAPGIAIRLATLVSRGESEAVAEARLETIYQRLRGSLDQLRPDAGPARPPR